MEMVWVILFFSFGMSYAGHLRSFGCNLLDFRSGCQSVYRLSVCLGFFNMNGTFSNYLEDKDFDSIKSLNSSFLSIFKSKNNFFAYQKKITGERKKPA